VVASRYFIPQQEENPVSKTQSLYCQSGKHEWQRPSQKGRKPLHCPNHLPAQGPADPQGVAARLAAGRERANRKKREASVERVLDFRRWLREDRAYTVACDRAELLEQTKPPRPAMFAELPSDYDYTVAREEGAI
jgi:hypothetical protein